MTRQSLITRSSNMRCRYHPFWLVLSDVNAFASQFSAHVSGTRGVSSRYLRWFFGLLSSTSSKAQAAETVRMLTSAFQPYRPNVTTISST